MNLSRPFILRPVATTLLMIAILLAGVLAYRLLPVSALPEVDYPTIQVTTLYPGASPDVTASVITAPLERQFGQIPGLERMTSTSSGGASVVTLRFALSQPLATAEQGVQAAINAASLFLPDDLPLPPVYSKVNPADAPVLTLAVSAEAMALPRVHDLVDTRLVPKLSQVPGVGLVTVGGGQRPAVRVQVDPRALAALGLSLEDVRTAIAASSVSQPKGGFDGPARASTIDANDQLRSADEYRRLVVAYRNGAPVRLVDVARVIDGPENARLAAWASDADGRQVAAIVIDVRRQPNANVIETADRIRALLPSLQATLPGGVGIRVLADRTDTIRASVEDVQRELVASIALVVMVIFLFLRSASATLIPAACVPLSLAGTFGVMHLAGFGLDNLTLMALTIATGFVVDDAIVMIENISRHVEEGETPLAAALAGARQIGFTIVSLTVSLIAVLIPLLFMGDVVGRLFRPFAATLAVAILVSAVVSLTLTPMMCARLLRRPGAPADPARRDLLDRVADAYARMLDRVLARPVPMLGVAGATLALTAVLYALVPKGLLPVQDTGLVQVMTEAPASVSFGEMARRQRALAEALGADPAVATLSSAIGVDGVNPSLNVGRMQIALRPRAERDADAATVIRRLGERAREVGGITAWMQPVQDLAVEGGAARTQYRFTLQDIDPVRLSEWTPRVLERLRALPELADVAGDAADDGLQAWVDIDRDAAGRLGVTTAAIDDALQDAFGQRLVANIFTQSSLYRVVLETDPGMHRGLSTFDDIRVPGTGGVQVPLSSVARVLERGAPLVIGHGDQFPMVTLSFNLAPGASLGDAVRAVERTMAELAPPAGLQARFEGAAAAFRGSLSSTLWLIAAAVVTMYIVLGVLYESFVHPVTILSTLPTATVGALAALLATGHELGLVAIIGIVLLIGLVKKNAIMMIDFALDAQRTRGLDARDAIREAARLRLRPILMTTMAALLGALPLALGGGTGSELRAPLGVTMVGGLVASQVLTLFTTPVIYLVFDRAAARLRRRVGDRAANAAGPVADVAADGHAR